MKEVRQKGHTSHDPKHLRPGPTKAEESRLALTSSLRVWDAFGEVNDENLKNLLRQLYQSENVLKIVELNSLNGIIRHLKYFS